MSEHSRWSSEWTRRDLASRLGSESIANCLMDLATDLCSSEAERKDLEERVARLEKILEALGAVLRASTGKDLVSVLGVSNRKV